MIKIYKNEASYEGNDKEIIEDMIAFHASVIASEHLIKLDEVAMKYVMEYMCKGHKPGELAKKTFEGYGKIKSFVPKNNKR